MYIRFLLPSKQLLKQYVQKAIFFLNLFFSASGFAQHNFKSGYIILPNSNDTIHGYIDYGSSQHNSIICNFKADSASAIKDYLPHQLKAYGFNLNRHYVSKNIKPEGDAAIYFLECLINGTVNLYFLNEQGRDRYFIEQSDIVYELTDEDISYMDNGVTYSKKSNKYKRTLSFLMKDAPSLATDIQKTQLTKKSLINLVKKYHELDGVQKKYTFYVLQKEHTVPKKIVFKYGVLVGCNYSKMKIGSTLYVKPYSFPSSVTSLTFKPELIRSNIPGIQLIPAQYLSDFKPFPGVFFNISRNGKNSFQLEANYYTNTYKTGEFNVKTDKVIIPILYRRGFGYFEKKELFINIGLFIGINLKTKFDTLFLTYERTEQDGNSYKFSTVTEYITQLKGSNGLLDRGLVGGVGLRYDLTKKNILELEFRSGLSNQSFLNRFDNDHIQISTSMRYWNNSLVAILSF